MQGDRHTARLADVAHPAQAATRRTLREYQGSSRRREPRSLEPSAPRCRSPGCQSPTASIPRCTMCGSGSMTTSGLCPRIRNGRGRRAWRTRGHCATCKDATPGPAGRTTRAAERAPDRWRTQNDKLQIDGYTIGEDHDDDPVLIDPDGRAVDTWRENYPYDERMSRVEDDRSTCSMLMRARFLSLLLMVVHGAHSLSVRRIMPPSPCSAC